jgi:chromosome segregation ATPase
VFQEQKATVELKDAQLKTLKERLAFLERQASPKLGHDDEECADGDHALEVRLLRVKKPARRTEGTHSAASESPAANEEKDATITNLRDQLAVAKKAADEVINQQAELSRAWDVVKKIQAVLKEERELHTQTREQLQEMSVRLEEEQQESRTSSSRLPTIEEDKDELEAMFDTAQEDNLRLHAELEALEKRLRDANTRMFTAEHEAVALREQVQLEQTISNDLETARPSVVHRVHFQRMEGQLKEVSTFAPYNSNMATFDQRSTCESS